MEKLDKEASDRLAFLAYIIPSFAESCKMGMPEGYRYLKKYGGLDFAFEHWWALHTDSTEWAVRDLYEVCRDNGGMR